MPTMSESEKPLVRQESWLIKVARTGLVAALYVVLTYLSSVFNLAFGPLQFRVSESLTLLPLIWGETVFGLTVGTLLSNLGSPYGIIDWVFGTLASFVALSLVKWIGRKGYSEWIAALAVSVVNALAVPFIILTGAMGLSSSSIGGVFVSSIYWSYAATIFIEEFCVVAFLGIPLIRTIKGRVLK